MTGVPENGSVTILTSMVATQCGTRDDPVAPAILQTLLGACCRWQLPGSHTCCGLRLNVTPWMPCSALHCNVHHASCAQAYYCWFNGTVYTIYQDRRPDDGQVPVALGLISDTRKGTYCRNEVDEVVRHLQTSESCKKKPKKNSDRQAVISTALRMSVQTDRNEARVGVGDSLHKTEESFEHDHTPNPM